MANAYREGKGWSIRAQYKGISIYKGGFSSARKAETYLREQQSIIDRDGKPARQGPERTSLAVALSDYARECLPYRKGARQDAQRVNNYLRAANLPVIKLTEFVPLGASLAIDTASDAKQNRTRYWDVALVDEPERNIPNSLVAHRDAQAQKQLAVQQARNRLGCMKVPNLSNYVQWLALRADGKIHGGIINLITFVKSLVHPNSGYLTQSPQLAEALHPALGLTGGWQELCSKTFEWTQKAFQQLSPKKQRSRDPFEPIRQVLELGNPMEAVSDMVQRMKAARPSTGGVTEAIWARDVLLIKLLASNPLRAKNVKLLSYRPDNSGQLRQARDGSWRIVITPEWFKNQAGAAKDQPYDMPVDEALWGDIERYIKHFRPHLAGAKESDFVFLSADGSADTNGWESLNKRVFQLTKRYLLHCPGAGPHAFRYINGTAILKALPGAWEVAAQVLHDKEETVRKHYAHLRGTDGAARAHAALKSAYGRM